MENEEYIENLKYLFEEEEIEKLNLPKRNSYTYLYIEDIEDYEYTNSIAYEMLRRNEEFKELTKKPFPTKTEDWTIKILELESIKEVEYKKLINAVKGDTLAVTRLSILCISVQSLLEIMYELENKDVNLEVIQQIFQAIKLKHSQSSKQVANKFGVARSTLLRHIAKQKRAS